MADQELLFSILRFVALVSPAVAIFMQLLQSSGEDESPAFTFLEGGFVFIFLGALIIMGQLWTTVQDWVTKLGITLVFGSLILIAAGIVWRAVPFTEDISISVNSLSDIWELTKVVIGRIVAFSLPLVLLSNLWFYSRPLIDQYLYVGPIWLYVDILPSELMTLFVLFIIIRLDIYLLNTGYLSDHTALEAIKESFMATFAMLIVLLVILIPTFALPYLLVFLSGYLYPISLTHVINVLPYIWASIVVVIIFPTELWGEDGDRLVE